MTTIEAASGRIDPIHWCEDDSTDLNNSSSFENAQAIKLSYYLSGPILLSLIIFGLSGNALCLYILSRPKRRPRVNVYLLTLAAWDWILLACSFFVYNAPELQGKSIWEWSLYVRALPFLYAIASMAHSCSIWIVVCLGVERYFALCFPIKHLLYWSEDWLRRTLLVGISVSGVLYSLPRLFETRIDYCLHKENARTQLIIVGSDLQNNASYRFWYKAVGGMLLFSIGPTISLLTLSIRVAFAMNTRAIAFERRLAITSIRQHSTNKRKPTKTTKNNEQETKYRSASVSSVDQLRMDSPYNTNKMLIVVVVKFLFCHSLPAVLDVCESTMGSDFDNNFLINTLIDISNALVVFNSSCNVVIYSLLSRRFRYEILNRWTIVGGKLRFFYSRKPNDIKINVQKESLTTDELMKP